MIPAITKQDLFWFFILFCCLFLLSFHFLDLWFTSDDSSVIYASTRDLWKLVIDRDTYLTFNKFFYTPLLPASFKVDVILFGLAPFGYHLNTLLLAFLTGVIGYRVFRLYMPQFESWVGIFLFMLSFPIVTIIGWLSLRHYLLGMFFALSSFYLFKKSEAHESRPVFVLSCVAALAALLCKEAFSPFPAVITLFGEGDYRRKALKSLPYFGIFVAYLFLRAYILGGFGGYIGGNYDVSAIDLLRRGISHLNAFASSVWGLKIAFFLFLFFLQFALHKRTAIVLTVLLFIVLSPFLFVKPVDPYFPARLIAVQFVFSFLLASILQYSRKRVLRLSALTLATFFLVLQIIHSGSTYDFTRQNSNHYKKFTTDILDKNREGKNVLVLISQADIIFYNFYYEAYRIIEKTTGERLGAVTTLTTTRDLRIIATSEDDSFDLMYLDDGWKVFSLAALNSLDHVVVSTDAPPKVTVRQRAQFFNVTIADDRDGEIYGALKTTFSDHNTGLQSAILPRRVSIGMGLARGKEVIYIFYCRDGVCSKPVILDPVSQAARTKGN